MPALSLKSVTGVFILLRAIIEAPQVYLWREYQYSPGILKWIFNHLNIKDLRALVFSVSTR